MIAWLYLSVILGGSDWGFFGHRLINRVAVYALPTEMIGWYKPHIDYLSDHAVDPDKRRYATRHEAVRHYIDLDHWGEGSFDHVPRYFDQALAFNIKAFQIIDGDTLFLVKPVLHQQWKDSIDNYDQRLRLVRDHYMNVYYDDLPSLTCESFVGIFSDIACHDDEPVYVTDVFSQHGIVPYHLQTMQHRLTNAFKNTDIESILRVSAEIGHYIGDASVPLHTTTNYNGQLTNQVGIHAFWESRIPELFALEEFDMVVGTATYIDDPVSYFWNITLDSHKEVDRVLSLDKELSESFPSDEQFCFEDRLNQNIRTQCRAYALAYHQAMDKMVEDRFRVAVKAVSDSWYTAWIDAGQPDAPLANVLKEKSTEDEELEKAVQRGKPRGRDHDD